MIVSVEVPVVRGGWLVQCIDSVLQQTSTNWVLSLLWDGGDALSRDILERVARVRHPRVHVHFGERSGIARARQFLTEQSHGDLVLPLDDDDVLEPAAVERFISAALAMPWAGILRARRSFIDEEGAAVRMDDWFPFERRHYVRGATGDVSNHAQPYAIRRALFLAAGGWQGFEEFEWAGEDCDCFARMEEVSEVELVDAPLYRYRLHDLRTSHRVAPASADTMWCHIADRAIARRGATVQRTNSHPPFSFRRHRRTAPSLDEVEVVIPFWETHEREIAHRHSRPAEASDSGQVVLHAGTHFAQRHESPLQEISRLAVAVSTTGPVEGSLLIALYPTGPAFSPAVVIRHTIQTGRALDFEFISVDVAHVLETAPAVGRIELAFEPAMGNAHALLLHTVRGDDDEMRALLRFFEFAPDHCRRGLERCLASLAAAGVSGGAIHVVEERDSSAANRNRGFRASRAPWILFMDDDAELGSPSALRDLLEVMLRLDADLAGPKLLNGEGRIYSGFPVTEPLTRETRVMGMGEVDAGQYDVDALAPWLPSTVLVAHRSVMLATGGFDERFKGSQHEDADFCLRARARGFDCCYAGSVTAIHHNALRNSHFSSNSAYFAQRWKQRPDLFMAPITRDARSRRNGR